MLRTTVAEGAELRTTVAEGAEVGDAVAIVAMPHSSAYKGSP